MEKNNWTIFILKIHFSKNEKNKKEQNLQTKAKKGFPHPQILSDDFLNIAVQNETYS